MTLEAIQARIAEHARNAPTKLAEERERNRKDFPEMAAWVDDMVKRFGKPKYLRIGRLDGTGRVITWGKRG